MADENKTKEELLAEIEALKKQLAQATSATGKAEAAASGEGPASGGQPGDKALGEGAASSEPVHPVSPAPVASEPHTRRGALGWIAPVILSLGTATSSGTAQAQADDIGGPLPTLMPTTRAPTNAAPTRRPTSRAPTSRAPTSRAPTAAPTRSPTVVGRCIPEPTVSPTLGMGSAPDAGLSDAAFMALGSARAAMRALLANSALYLPSRGDLACAFPQA
ncbi:MAG TPA: hypothetical protein VGG33_08855 [Polyangia bacterium]